MRHAKHIYQRNDHNSDRVNHSIIQREVLSSEEISMKNIHVLCLRYKSNALFENIDK